MLPFYLLSMLPKPSFWGGFFVFLSVSILVILLVALLSKKRVGFDHYSFLMLAAGPAFLFGYVALSMVFNIGLTAYTDLTEFVRVGLIILFFFLPIVRGQDFVSSGEVLLFFVIFFCVQAIVGFSQFFNVLAVADVFAFIWNTEKVLDARIVGTMANPNFLGVICSFLSAVMIFLYTERKVGFLVGGSGFIICLVFILISGSRTSLISCFSVSLLIVWAQGVKKTWFFWLSAGAVTVFIVPFFSLLTNVEGLRYITEPIRLYEKSATVWEVSAVSARLDIWNEAIGFYKEVPGIGKFFFGVGPAKSHGLDFLDNQYLFWFIKYGGIGFFIFSAIPLCFMIYSFYVFKGENKSAEGGAKLSALCCMVFGLILFIHGFLAETFSSIYLGAPFYYLCGTLLSGKMQQRMRLDACSYL